MNGEPFTGHGKFKFVLLDRAEKRVWTSGDNQVPIEADMPTGSISLPVTDGVYRVSLGDISTGMKPFPPGLLADWKNLKIEIWFSDGTNGWAKAGVTRLTKELANPLEVGAGLAAGTQDDLLQSILLEVRRLRSEVGLLQKQLSGEKSGAVVQPVPPAAVKPAPPDAQPKVEPKPVKVSLADVPRHSLGPDDAPVVLVEFTDLECGYCKRFFEKTFPLLKEKYIDTGKLRFVSRNYALQTHPRAGPAAEATLSAAEQDPKQYWAMRAWLFENNRELNDLTYGKFVKDAGLDVPRFLKDYTAKSHGSQLDEDLAAGRAVGITGTPSFVLGTTDGKIIVGERIVGAKSFEYFESKINSLLESKTGEGPAGSQKPEDADKKQ